MLQKSIFSHKIMIPKIEVKNNTCHICLDLINKNDEIFISECNHQFYMNCLFDVAKHKINYCVECLV